MRLDRRSLIAGLAAFPLIAAKAAPDEGAPQALELPIPDMKRLSATVWVGKLTDGVWLTCFTSKLPSQGWYPANGMIIAGADGATIVDPGWSTEQGKLILETAASLTGGKVARGIATHYHTDRTGGIGACTASGVPAYGNPLSVGLAQAYGDPVPQPVKGLEKDAQQLGPVELYFPGAGHTRDNITVWHAPSRTLFGGCLIKSTTAKDLGNTIDGDLAAYGRTVARLAARYPSRRWTIPGHGTIAGDAIAWTRKLAA